jgi:hypothetical protein
MDPRILDLSEWASGQLHAPARFTPGERAPGTPRTGDWVGPRADLDDMEK